MSPKVRLAVTLSVALLMIALAFRIDRYMRSNPMVVEGTIVQSKEQFSARHMARDITVLRTDGVKQGLFIYGKDDRFLVGRRVWISETGNVVRHCRFLSADGREEDKYDDPAISPLLIFLPCGLLLIWVGVRQYRLDQARLAGISA